MLNLLLLLSFALSTPTGGRVQVHPAPPSSSQQQGQAHQAPPSSGHPPPSPPPPSQRRTSVSPVGARPAPMHNNFMAENPMISQSRSRSAASAPSSQGGSQPSSSQGGGHSQVQGHALEIPPRPPAASPQRGPARQAPPPPSSAAAAEPPTRARSSAVSSGWGPGGPENPQTRPRSSSAAPPPLQVQHQFSPEPPRPDGLRPYHDQLRHNALPAPRRYLEKAGRYVERNKFGVASALVGGTGAILTATGVGAVAGIPLMAGGMALGAIQSGQNYMRDRANNPDMATGNAIGAGVGAAASLGAAFIPGIGSAVAPIVHHGVQALHAGIAGGGFITSQMADKRHNDWIKELRDNGRAPPLLDVGRVPRSKKLNVASADPESVQDEHLDHVYDGGFDDENEAGYEALFEEDDEVQAFEDVDSGFEEEDTRFELNDEDFEDQLNFEMDMEEYAEEYEDQDMEFEEEARIFEEEDAKFEFDSE